MTEHVLGVDLGGTNVRVAVAPLSDAQPTDVSGGANGGVESRQAEVSAVTAESPGSIVAQIVSLTHEVLTSSGADSSRLDAMAVGVPGVVPVGDGAINLAPNLPALGQLDLRAALGKRLAVPVALENDVNLATLAEHRHGLAVGISDFVFISIGTGVGMGVVAGDVLQRGATGAAGEIGFLPVGLDPFDDVNQVHGPLEEAAGGIGIARRYQEAARDGTRPVTAFDVYARAASGDREALAVLDEQARAIALALQAVHSVLDPALVVFGGGIGSRQDFVARVRSYVARLTRRSPRIETTVLGERAGLVGALTLARAIAGAAPSGDGTGSLR